MGVQRQYSGTAGRIENCQIGVFLTYATAQGRVLLDRELYLPQGWAGDGERRREAGVPEEVVFRTKPQLARELLERAVAAGVPFRWVAGDEVYGNDRNLRLWLEGAGIPHVLAIKRNEKLWVLTDKGPRQVRADQLASGVEESHWSWCSAGKGNQRSPGLRLGLGGDPASCGNLARGTGFWPAAALLSLKSWPITSASVQRTQPWQDLVRVAGTRWAIEECFEEAKGQVGLDQYEVRKWEGWYRHITPVSQHGAGSGPAGPGLPGGGSAKSQRLFRRKKGGEPEWDEALIPLTVPEVRRLLYRLIWRPMPLNKSVLAWSRWRRRHQARARRCHYQRRLQHLSQYVRL